MSSELLRLEEARRPALPCPHFPAPFQAVLFRNWGMVPLERLAQVLDCTVEEAVAAGRELGLEPDEALCPLWLERGYQTLIRQNWHLLSWRQLLLALDWTAERLAYILKEDDFLWIKLGRCKPLVEEPRLRPLSPDERARTARLRALRQELLDGLPARTQAPFDFLAAPAAPVGPPDNGAPGLRLLYAYSALYGDPLAEDAADPFPDHQLDAYAAAGVNALWLQAVLYTLVPWMDDGPVTAELSRGWEGRLRRLRGLARRMARRGIRLMLYLNEPRTLPEAFFRDHGDWRGHQGAGEPFPCLCTSVPEVLARLKDGVRRLFEAVPDLGGLFCITRSENRTSCWSHTSAARPPSCPRCAGRRPEAVIAEVIRALAEGAWAGRPDAEVIAWNWGWPPEWSAGILDGLPQGVRVQCVSETDLPTCEGGCHGRVADYSMSKPGPGPLSQAVWRLASERGLRCAAKVQLNCTWELSAVPWIPVWGLVHEHLQNLRRLGVGDFMLSWTLGGYPGGNLRLLTRTPGQLASEEFGAAVAPRVLQAIGQFDAAFRHFPLDGTATLYHAPQNFGPMTLLHPEPTGWQATMVGFPYDDLASWRGAAFPEDVFEEAFRQVSVGWSRGCAVLRRVRPEELPDEASRRRFADLLSVAEAADCHFRSAWQQIVFVRRRNAGDWTAMREAVEDEARTARRMLSLVRADARLGYEASNHYLYTEAALVEKLYSCRWTLDWLQRRQPQAQP